MLYVFRNKEGLEETFVDNEDDRITVDHELIGVYKDGQYIDAEQKERIRVRQDIHRIFEINDAVERERHWKQLNEWGLQ